MVRQRSDAQRAQLVGELVAPGTRLAVDDALLIGALADELDDLVGELVLGADLVGEVGALEAAAVLRGVAKGELMDDVVGDAGRGGRGEGHDGDVAEAVTEVASE